MERKGPVRVLLTGNDSAARVSAARLWLECFSIYTKTYFVAVLQDYFLHSIFSFRAKYCDQYSSTRLRLYQYFNVL